MQQFGYLLRKYMQRGLFFIVLLGNSSLAWANPDCTVFIDKESRSSGLKKALKRAEYVRVQSASEANLFVSETCVFETDIACKNAKENSGHFVRCGLFAESAYSPDGAYCAWLRQCRSGPVLQYCTLKATDKSGRVAFEIKIPAEKYGIFSSARTYSDVPSCASLRD